MISFYSEPGAIMSEHAGQILQQILNRAVEMDADEITLEYVPEGIEVCYCRGHTGVGHVVTDHALISLIVSKARPEESERGRFQLIAQRQERTVIVETYESFGETALRLRLRQAHRGGRIPRKR
jgi:hypothetical protein